MGWTVAIGIDTHKQTHVAVALDRLGAQLDAFAAPATSAGYLALHRWAHGLGEPVFVLEGAASYGAGLARFMQAAGCTVYEWERPQRPQRRRGKNHLIDALLAERRLLTGERLGRLRGLSGPREDLRLLLLERRSAIRARTATLNQLQALVVTAPARLRSRLEGQTSEQLADAAARLRRGEGEQAVVRGVLRRLGRRVLNLDAELAELDRELEAILSALVPELLAECGVGPVCAAQLVVSSGDPARMASEASFAALAGTQPRRRLERQAAAPPAEPRRRPATEPRPARDRAQPRPLPQRNRRLLPAPHRHRQDDPRSAPLHQTNARPLLPPQTLRASGLGLDNIEASR
jgi:transposase